MSWEKVGKTLVTLISCIGSIVAIYAVLKDDTKLEAYLSYDYQSYPRQFSERVNKASDKLDYGYLYDGIKGVASDALTHEQIDKIVSLSQAPYLHIFDGPFKKGPDVYPAGLYIYLTNTGEKVVKDVHIKLPAKGLVRIRDDSGNETVMEEPTSRVIIPSLVQNGIYRVWVYFDGDLKALKKEGVRIGYSDGVAKIEVFEEFSGLEAEVAKYSAELLTLLMLLATLLIFAVVVLFMVLSDGRSQADTAAS